MATEADRRRNSVRRPGACTLASEETSVSHRGHHEQLGGSTPVRPALPEDLLDLASIWRAVLDETYADFLPDLVGRMSSSNLAERLRPILKSVLVLGPPGNPEGFCALRGNEIYQFFVANTARGTWRTRELLRRAEDEIYNGGAEKAWLTCVVGNHRARGFYEKNGWRVVGTEPCRLGAAERPFNATAWRLEKALAWRREAE